MPTILGIEVGAIGYGLMGLTWNSKRPTEEQAFAAMRSALKAGANFWNGGEFYGPPEANSLQLLEKYFTRYPEDADKVILSIKGGIKNMRPDGSPEGIRASVDNCLKLLNGKKKIDIFECARVDKTTPIDVTLTELEKYVKEGKIGGIALSEVNANTIKTAVSITKIVAVEAELSLWAPDIFSNGVAIACAENDIPVVAYSPIGRGLLTGNIKSIDDVPDKIKHTPRFEGKAAEINMQLVKQVQQIAKKKGVTTAQLAISWCAAQSKRNGNPEIFPIPGASTVERVEENSKEISFSSEELDEISATLEKCKLVGARYGGFMGEMTEG